MATRFRLTSDTTTPSVSPAYQSYTHANASRRILHLAGADSSALTNTAQTPDASDHIVDGDTSHVQFVSAPLGAGLVFTAGDAFDYAIQGDQDSLFNNLFTQIFIGLVSNDGTTALATLRSKMPHDVEMPATIGNNYHTSTLDGGYTCAGGERLVVEFSVTGSPTDIGGTQGHNAVLRWGSDGASGDLPEDDIEFQLTYNPWLEFANTLSWQLLVPMTVLRNVPRPRAAVAQKVAVSSKARIAPRLRTSGSLFQSLVSKARAIFPRLLTSVVGLRMSAAGQLRMAPRLMAEVTLLLPTIVSAMGVLFASPRLRASVGLKVYATSTLRAASPLFPGTAAGTRLAVSSTARGIGGRMTTSATAPVYHRLKPIPVPAEIGTGSPWRFTDA